MAQDNTHNIMNILHMLPDWDDRIATLESGELIGSTAEFNEILCANKSILIKTNFGN